MRVYGHPLGVWDRAGFYTWCVVIRDVEKRELQAHLVPPCIVGFADSELALQAGVAACRRLGIPIDGDDDEQSTDGWEAAPGSPPVSHQNT